MVIAPEDSRGRRLDGWKAIAGYFKRDRSTAMRWAAERNLPVHRIPGGKQGSVFAFEGELAVWALRNTDAGAPNVEPVATPDRGPAWWRRPVVMAGAAILLLALAGGLFLTLHRATPPHGQRYTMPADPVAAADYVAARDAWARRTRDDIAYSITLYEKVIHRAPDFAPARAALAEAWLIYCEYGEVSQAKAYGIARIAAQKALSLDPDLASGHRALGFIQYWNDNDPVSAVKAFKRAIALDDGDGQTHFWYANILADLGEAQAADRQYVLARLLSPGLPTVEVEYACAQWQAGRDAQALALMTALEKRFPADATIHNCLTWIYMSRGDILNYAGELSELAHIRNEPDLLRLSAQVDAAVKRDPRTAHRVLIADARREIALGMRRIRETPAFYASSMGDRVELLELMKEASLLGERWYTPSITERIEKRWRDDPTVMALLKALRAPRPKLDDL